MDIEQNARFYGGIWAIHQHMDGGRTSAAKDEKVLIKSKHQSLIISAITRKQEKEA
jgi:hypothetical protein